MILFRVLLSLLFPGHTIFVFIIFTVKIFDLPSPLFLIFYLVAAVIQVRVLQFGVAAAFVEFQVAVLLYMCQILVYWMWKRGVDPDNAAIPYLTAVQCLQ